MAATTGRYKAGRLILIICRLLYRDDNLVFTGHYAISTVLRLCGAGGAHRQRKSTLASLLMGYYPDARRNSVDGREILS